MKKFIVILMTLMTLTTACSKGILVEDTQTPLESELCVYLTNEDKTALVPYYIKTDNTDMEKQISTVLRTLKEGVDDQAYQATIPETLVIEAVNVSGENAIVHIGEDFIYLNQVDFILCRSSLIKSLTAIDGIASLEFFINGIPMKDDNGIVYGQFFDEDVVTEAINTSSSEEEVNLILYFPDSQGERLVRVNRKVMINNTEQIEAKIIEELKLVPEGYGVTSVMPQESQLKSIEVTKGICYVDFNDAFRTKNYGGSTGELMTIYAIVNSLTELPNISRVQFLIEGEKSSYYKGHLDFSSLFENDITLVNTQVQYEE